MELAMAASHPKAPSSPPPHTLPPHASSPTDTFPPHASPTTTPTTHRTLTICPHLHKLLHPIVAGGGRGLGGRQNSLCDGVQGI